MLHELFEAADTDGSGGITRDEYIDNVASALMDKLPALFDLNKLRKDLEADGFSPVFVVLVQELERWEKLNLRMSKSLSMLKKAIKGDIAMSGDLDALGLEAAEPFALSPRTSRPRGCEAPCSLSSNSKK